MAVGAADWPKASTISLLRVHMVETHHCFLSCKFCDLKMTVI